MKEEAAAIYQIEVVIKKRMKFSLSKIDIQGI